MSEKHVIRIWRDEHNVTQQELADRVKTPKSKTSRWTIAQIERGKRQPSVTGQNLTARLSKVTGIPREKIRPDIYKEE